MYVVPAPQRRTGSQHLARPPPLRSGACTATFGSTMGASSSALSIADVPVFPCEPDASAPRCAANTSECEPRGQLQSQADALPLLRGLREMARAVDRGPSHSNGSKPVLEMNSVRCPPSMVPYAFASFQARRVGNDQGGSRDAVAVSLSTPSKLKRTAPTTMLLATLSSTDLFLACDNWCDMSSSAIKELRALSGPGVTPQRGGVSIHESPSDDNEILYDAEDDLCGGVIDAQVARCFRRDGARRGRAAGPGYERVRMATN